jgi:hypothetical protein
MVSAATPVMRTVDRMELPSTRREIALTGSDVRLRFV